MPWTYRDGVRDKATTDEIEKLEDRAAAIVAAGYLEERLMLAITERMIRDQEVSDPLFKGTGALANFAAKIDLAYLLGLISKPQRAALNTVRKVRNKFAHDLEPLTFSSQNITAMCRNLADERNLIPLRSVLDVMQKQNTKIQFLSFFESWFAEVKKTKNDSRTIYIHTIQIVMLQIEAMAGHSQFVVSLLSPLLGKSAQHFPLAPQSGSRTR